LPPTHFGVGGIAHVGQGAVVTNTQLAASHGFCAALIFDSVPFATEIPQTPGKPHDVNICVQSASVVHASDPAMTAFTLRRVCSHFSFGVRDIVLAMAEASGAASATADADASTPVAAARGDGFSSGFGTRREPVAAGASELELDEWQQTTANGSSTTMVNVAEPAAKKGERLTPLK
jgi:hypothetical protein